MESEFKKNQTCIIAGQSLSIFQYTTLSCRIWSKETKNLPIAKTLEIKAWREYEFEFSRLPIAITNRAIIRIFNLRI